MSNSGGGRRQRSVPERLLLYTAEFVAVGLAGLAAIRLLHLDSTRTGSLISTFLPWLLLPSYILLLVGLFARRARLAVAALVLVATHLFFVIPELPGAQADIPQQAVTAPQLRVVTSNILSGNRQLFELLDEIQSADPDVVAFQELTDSQKVAFAQHPMAAEYPHTLHGQNGTSIVSRLPLANQQLVQVANQRYPLATVEVSGEEVAILAVHPNTPLGNHPAWAASLDQLGGLAAIYPNRLVMLGDFNATFQHRQFRDLVDTGDLRDAHNERGDGWGATWPANGRGRLVNRAGPMLRIDHILVSEGIEVITFDHLDAPGTDHIPLVSDIALTRLGN